MYFIIAIIFIAYIIWTWNSTNVFENVTTRIGYVLLGTIAITVITLIIFTISKIGVVYPKQEMVGDVRKVILLIFVPINGFLFLTRITSIVARVKNGDVSKDELSKKLKIYGIIFLILVIIECIYFKKIQLNMIDIINANNSLAYLHF